SIHQSGGQVLLSTLGTGTSRTTCRRPLLMGPSLIFAYLAREYLRRSSQSLTKLGVSVRRKARGRYRQIDGAVPASSQRRSRHVCLPLNCCHVSGHHFESLEGQSTKSLRDRSPAEAVPLVASWWSRIKRSGMLGPRGQADRCALSCSYYRRPATRSPWCFTVRLHENGRGRDEDCAPPPAQIPACAANAPGSSLRWWRRSGGKALGVVRGSAGRSGWGCEQNGPRRGARVGFAAAASSTTPNAPP